MSLQYWKSEHHDALALVSTYAEMYDVVRKVIAGMPAPRGQVCGPISTGGAGLVEANLVCLGEAVTRLTEMGYTIFSQEPLQKHFGRIKKLQTDTEFGQYNTALLDDLYRPLFESGEIHTLYF